jgi:RNA polymerase-binding transcription factor DksA
MTRPNRAGSPAQQDIHRHLPQLRRALQQQRSFRVEQLAELTRHASEGGGRTGDDALDEITVAVTAAAEIALAEIDAAFDRIAEQTYGQCQLCGTQISLERLEILPMASMCMICQRSHEAG